MLNLSADTLPAVSWAGSTLQSLKVILSGVKDHHTYFFANFQLQGLLKTLIMSKQLNVMTPRFLGVTNV